MDPKEVWICTCNTMHGARSQALFSKAEADAYLDVMPVAGSPRAVRFVPVPRWAPWTQDAAEELQEEASAWLCWRGVVQRRPYVWLFDENGEGYWFCAAPDGESRMGDGVTHFALIGAPPAPPNETP
jgi:hypothetical protein